MPVVLGILILIVLLVFIVFQISSYRQIAPWVPSNTKVLREALTKINAQPDQCFVDLGAGDGRAVFLAAEEFGLQAHGVELSPVVYLYAKLRQLSHKDKKITLTQGNALKHSLADYDIVYLYALPDTIKHHLQQKFISEMKPGSYILSYNFTFPDKQPLFTLGDHWRRLYVYQI